MYFTTSLFMLLTACIVLVQSYPQNQIGFPDDSEAGPGDDGLGDRQGFRPPPGSRPGPGFRPQPGGNMRPPGGSFGRPPFPGNNFQPGNNFGSPNNPGGNFGTAGQPGNNFGSPNNPGGNFGTGGQPGNNFGSPNNPGGNFGTGGQPGNNFGSPNNPGGNFGSTNNNPPDSNSQNPLPGGNTFQNTGNQTQTPVTASSTTPTPTTRIPPRDPTNRIVYIVSCPCQFTRQYTPVCGTDGQTYGNMGVLQCARQCGTDVQVFLMGACVGNRG